MRLATTDGQGRIAPTPGMRARCPVCHRPVLAKCGRIIVWHWAHDSSRECDDWAEPDSQWHTGWQDWGHLSSKTQVVDALLALGASA